ncbi:MAG: hypothetical protein IJT44_11690 [Clostridia bacterium]|nr:hypothetical protein [Clostridia bacterium]
MKKALSLLLALCLTFCLCVPFEAGAKDTPLIEKAVRFSKSTYIRFGKNVVGVSEDFYVQIDEYVYGTDPVPVRLQSDEVHVYTGERTEVFLSHSVKSYDTVHLYGLILADGTSSSCSIRGEDRSFEEKNSSAFSFSVGWKFFQQDVLTVVEEEDGIIGYSYTVAAAESVWKIDFTGDTVLDAYLARYAELKAEGIEMERQGDEYRFSSVGDGKVLFLLDGTECGAVTVHVREKREIKRTKLIPAFLYNVSYGMAYGYWLGPLVFVAALPLGTAFGIVKVARILRA